MFTFPIAVIVGKERCGMYTRLYERERTDRYTWKRRNNGQLDGIDTYGYTQGMTHMITHNNIRKKNCTNEYTYPTARDNERYKIRQMDKHGTVREDSCPTLYNSRKPAVHPLT